MRNVGLLLRKDLIALKNKFKNNGKQNVLSTIFYVLFFALLLVGITFLYSYLISSYFKITPQSALAERQKEVLTLTILLVSVIAIISGVKRIYKNIIFTPNKMRMATLPIDSKEIFIYKIIYILLNQLSFIVLGLVPLGIAFGIASVAEVGYYFLLVFSILLLPFVTTFLSLIFSIPYYYFVKFTQSKYILLIIVYALLFIGLFVLYSVFLGALNTLLSSGKLSGFFNEERLSFISRFSSFCQPFTSFALLLQGEKLALSIVVVISSVALSLGLGIVVLIYLFPLLSEDSEKRVGAKIKPRVKEKKSSQFAALIKKEFISVLRSPSAAFSLFSVALILPVLVYLSSSLMNTLVEKVLYIDIKFLLSFFVLALFALLLTIYCSSSISREGKTFYKQLLLPVNVVYLLLAKVVVSYSCSIFSILVSLIVLICTGFVNLLQALVIFVCVGMLSLALSLFSIKRDLLYPTYNKEESSQSSNITNIIAFIGVVLINGSILLYGLINTLKAEALSVFIVYVLPILISIVLLGLSFLYFKNKLNKVKMGEKK